MDNMPHSLQNVETENIKLMFGTPTSKALIITFAHMDFDHAADRFWGEETLRKAGFDTVGFVCKSNCWFPLEEMERLAKYVHERSKYYHKIILYGSSMGAYAAVKFSRLLGADASLAFSPQYSIDPNDVMGYDHRLSNYFKIAVNQDMAVKPSDLAGTIYLFCDYSVTEDKWNCDKIASIANKDVRINQVNLLNLGHETIDAFSGTQLISELMDFCVADDLTSICRLAAISRRRSQRRIFNLLIKLRKRSPALADKMFAKQSDQFHPYWRSQWPTCT